MPRKRLRKIAKQRASLKVVAKKSQTPIFLDIPSLFQKLPAELRTRIWQELIPDQHPYLQYDKSLASTVVQAPAIARAFPHLRQEILPFCYQRTAFLYAFTYSRGFDKVIKTIKTISHEPSAVDNMRKVTILGRNRNTNAQIGLTFDFTNLEVIDARWRPYLGLGDSFTGPNHIHLYEQNIQAFIEALRMESGTDGSSTIEGVMNTARQCFRSEEFWSGLRLRGAPTQSRWTTTVPIDWCACSQPVKVAAEPRYKPMEVEVDGVTYRDDELLPDMASFASELCKGGWI